MQAALLASALLAGVLLPGTAAADHLPHGPCGFSTLTFGEVVHVDVWADDRCVGATVYATMGTCAVGGQHQHALGVHLVAFYGAVCETGVLLELP